jgi:dihydrofolate reductase
MRKLIIQEFLTLDGVMQAPGGKTEDTEGGFEYGGWQMSYGDEIFGKFIMETYGSVDALLLGRKTYDIFAGYWPTTGKDMEIGKIINGMTKYVASRTKDAGAITWEKSVLLKDDIAAEISKLKEQPGKNILVAGSGDFAQTLMRENLIDEFQLLVHPLVLGTGKRLFKEGGPKQMLKLSSSQASTSGVVFLRYVRG